MLSLILAASMLVSQWQPLEPALEEARAGGKLIALYVESGVSRDDDRVEAWIAEASEHDSVRQSLGDMVLARLPYASPLLRDYEEIRVVAKRRTPHFIVVDPAGGVITEVNAFGDVGSFAGSLISLRAQAKLFLQSAQYRLDGKPGPAYFMRGVGLGNAGAEKESKAAFESARDIAKKTGDRVLEQRADLGIAAIDLDTLQRHETGLSAMKKIAEHPLAPEIGANAWMLIGDDRKTHRDPNGAISAYTNAYNMVPPESTMADSARRFLEMMGGAVPERAVRAAGRVRLIFSRQPVIAGDLDVAAVVPEGTARVEYFVDGARVNDSSRAPFHATLPLGAAPRVHELKAVARDRAGAALGEDAVTINDHPERLSVQIVKPASEHVDNATTVEAMVRVPDGVKVDAVDVFWNERMLTTLSSTPYCYELTLPERGAFGYIRVVAHDSTGTTAEDAKLINGASAAEEIRVDAVEIYAIVQDRHGKIVDGLTAKDFLVKEDGVPVAVSLRSAATDPITVGLALDTSGSMRPVMMDVAEYASAFLRDSLTKGDRTLVAVFDAEPHLTQTLTDDLAHVSTQFAGANTGGGTAIWDAMAFTMRQLRSATGKRSLLVFTDGYDNGSTTQPGGALAVARETGVAVYMVLMFDSVNSERRLFGPRFTAMEMITRETGGALFRSPRKVDLPMLFARVRDDTRGEYILSFVSKSTKKRSEMRKLTVEVPGRSVNVRAMTGYYPH